MKPVALLGYEGIRELPHVVMHLGSLSSSRSMSINRSRKTGGEKIKITQKEGTHSHGSSTYIVLHLEAVLEI